MRAARSPFWRWRSIFTPHRDLGASGPVLGGGRCWGVSLSFLGFFVRSGFPLGCLEPEAAQFGCPKDGPYQPRFEESGGAESGFPEVPWGFLGIPRQVGLPPFRGSCWGFLGGFDFWALLGCVWPACPMCIRHSVGLEHSCRGLAVGSRPFEGGSNPCFPHG